MGIFTTLLFSGLAIGCSYALLGIGYVVIHRVTGIVNFAQGMFAVVGGLIAATLLKIGLPHGLSELAALVGAAAVGLIVGVLAMSASNSMAALLVTIGIGTGFYAINLLFFGSTPLSFEMFPGSVEIMGGLLQTQYVAVIIVTIAAFAALVWFFNHSYRGKGMTAAASNPYAAKLQGINVKKAGYAAFALSGLIGGIAGILIAPIQSVSYASDLNFAIYGFAAAVFGGLTQIPAALYGGLILGVAQSFIGGFFGGQNQIAGALTLVLIVMVIQAGRRHAVVEEAS